MNSKPNNDKLGKVGLRKKKKFVSLGLKIDNSPFDDDDLSDTEIYIGKIDPKHFNKK